MSFHPGMGTRPNKMAASHLTLVLPGLVWPGRGVASALESLALPALSTILGRGRPEHGPGQSWLQSLARQWAAESLDWGALRLTGEADFKDMSPPRVLCADPVSLNFSSDALILRGPREIALDEQEAKEIVTSLNAEFSEAGQWLLASPTRFYLLPRTDLDACFHPLDDVLGRPVSYFQPEGTGAREASRLNNDLQVWLHNHAVNQQRRDKGLLTANALWLWGQPVPAATDITPPAAFLSSRDPIMIGLARRGGCSLLDAPEQAVSGRPGRSWVHDECLLITAQNGDFSGWAEALAAIERDLLRPALESWRRGRISEIRLFAPSDKSTLQASLPRAARWAFWRSPADRPTLARLLQAD